MIDQSGEIVVLLGAGASVAAGIPTSRKMTSKIYDDLNSIGSTKDFAQFLAYLRNKIVAHEIKKGNDPAVEIDVEVLFDTLIQIIERHNFPVSQFIHQWDTTIDEFESKIKNIRNYRPAFIQMFKAMVRAVLNLEGITEKRSALIEDELDHHAAPFLHFLSQQRPYGYSPVSEKKQPFFSSLFKQLNFDRDNVKYFEPVITDKRVKTIATLNYDVTVEQACKNIGLPYRYGIEGWSTIQTVGWEEGEYKKILKLHGSVNWTSDGDIQELSEINYSDGRERMLIFGGTGNKDLSSGPFLPLLFEFEKILMNVDLCLVIGYSFRDAHVNGIINRWRRSRPKSLLAIVDPDPPPTTPAQILREETKPQFAKNYHGYALKAVAEEGIKMILNDIQNPYGCA